MRAPVGAASRGKSGVCHGTDWEQVVADGFGNPDNESITALTNISDTLYAATGNPISGFEIWSSSSGDSLSWTPVITGGLGYAGNSERHWFCSI